MMGRHNRSAAVLGALLVLALGVSGGCGSTSSNGSTTNSAAVPADAAPDFSGTTLDGLSVSLSEYRGKPLVLAFMASW